MNKIFTGRQINNHLKSQARLVIPENHYMEKDTTGCLT